MRNGNTEQLVALVARVAVLSLPMRNGNYLNKLQAERPGAVLSLPMRNGNHVRTRPTFAKIPRS